jgi:hypothetical protein
MRTASASRKPAAAHAASLAHKQASAVARDTGCSAASVFDFAALAVNGVALQRKLTVGSAHDPSEAEADRAAERVMRMADPSPISMGGQSSLRRKCAACEEEGNIQRKAESGLQAVEAPPIVDDVLASPGRPLDAATRAFMEPRFGHDFSSVRVHTGDRAARSAEAVDARAYTVGRDIVFGRGAYAPQAAGGRTLLAHELAHTLQQGAGGSGALRRVGMGDVHIAEGMDAEREAEEKRRRTSTEPTNMAHRILLDSDVAAASAAAPGAKAASRSGIPSAVFVLHDTGSQVSGAKIAEHKAEGRRSVGEGAGAYAPQSGSATVTHDPLYGSRRPSATQYERGNDVMSQPDREKSYRKIWKETARDVRESALDTVLSNQGSSSKEAARERAKAIKELDAKKGDVHSAGAWAVEDICKAVYNGSSKTSAADPAKAGDLDTDCRALAPLFIARESRTSTTTNVEMVQDAGSACSTKDKPTPLSPYSADQYAGVVGVYKRAAVEARYFPEITTHFLIDKVAGDHCDPRCFDLPRLYSEIAAAFSHPKGSSYGIAPAFGTSGSDNVWWFDDVCGGPHP